MTKIDVARTVAVWADAMGGDDSGEVVLHRLLETLRASRTDESLLQPFAIQDAVIAAAFQVPESADEGDAIWWGIASNTIGAMVRDIYAQRDEQKAAHDA